MRHCNTTSQTRGNILQHTFCNTLQHLQNRDSTQKYTRLTYHATRPATRPATRKFTATHTPKHTATPCNTHSVSTLQLPQHRDSTQDYAGSIYCATRPATREFTERTLPNTLQRPATHTLQHTATTPEPRLYTELCEVNLSCDTPGDTQIYYTLDGCDPSSRDVHAPPSPAAPLSPTSPTSPVSLHSSAAQGGVRA